MSLEQEGQFDALLGKYGYKNIDPEDPEYKEAKALMQHKLDKIRREALKVAILEADNRESTRLEEETGLAAVKRGVKMLRKL